MISNDVMRVVLIVMALCLCASGCGDEAREHPAAGQGGAAGSSGGQGGSEVAGTGGGTGGTGLGSGGMSGASGSMACGTSMCRPITAPEGSVLIACCVPETSRCGVIADAVAMKCVEVGQIGTPTEQCPGELNVLQAETPGCCQQDGDCGLQSGVLMGCVERTEYPATFLASGEALTDSRRCGADEDAGL